MQRSILFLFAILILSVFPLQADIGPGPSPEPSVPGHAPPSEQETPSPVTIDSTIKADMAPPPPTPEATSPVPMIIAGLAATAGVVLLGLWIARQGRSGNAEQP
jgi:hypothetical protein